MNLSMVPAPRNQSSSNRQSPVVPYNRPVAASQQSGALSKASSLNQMSPSTPKYTTAITNLATPSTGSQRPANEVAKQSTPVSKSSASQTPQPSPADSSRGRWRHPRMDEIQRRQNRTVFDRNNTNVVLYNAFGLVLSFGLSAAQNAVLSYQTNHSLRPYSFYTYLLLRLFLLANIAAACLPLFRKPDACEDIPLTPHQRKLLGLPPMSRPATPQEQAQYVTPPRYSRSATPASTSSSLYVQAAGSPLSGRGEAGSAFGSPADSPRGASGSYYYSPSGPASASGDGQGRINGSPYGPSPLRNGIGAERRRLSYTSGRNSPLGIGSGGEFEGLGGSAGAFETPTKGHRASVGLNSKWLYEKGRGSPSMWGSGSVFM